MAIKKQIIITAETEAAQKNVKNLEKEVKDLTKAQKEQEKQSVNSNKIIQALDDATGGAVSRFTRLKDAAFESVKSVKLFSASLSGLSKALIATGIGALVVALGAIVAYWDDIKGLISGVSSEQEKLNVLAQENVDIQKRKFDSISDQENVLKLQGKSEKEILQLKQAQLDEVIAATEAQIEQNKITLKAQIEAEKRNKEILSGILKSISIPITAVLATIDQIGKALGKDFGLMQGFDKLANFVFDPDAIEEEGNKAIEEQQLALDKLTNQRAGFQLQLNKIDEDAAAKRIENNQKEINAKNAAQQKEFEDRQKLREQIEALEDEYFNSLLDRQTQEENAVADKYFNLIEQAKAFGEDTAILEEAQQAALAEIKNRYDEEERLRQAELDALEDQRRADELAREQALQDAKFAMYNNYFGAVANVLGQQNKTAKKFAVAQALMNTYQGISNVWKEDSELGLVGAGFAQRLATTALVASQGFATVKNIMKTNPTGGASMSMGGGGSAPQPAFNVVGTSGVNQIAEQLSQEQEPVQAFVVGSNVTTQQEMDRNIVTTASLG